MATKLQANTNIVFGKFDVSENEIPGFPVDTYPSLKYFQEGPNDELKIVDFTG